IQHMQKALSQMNIQLHNVISDITGITGMKIIRAIIAGERDAKLLARHRNQGCKNAIEIIEKSLQGNYRDEHVFALTQALELFDTYQTKIKMCDQKIETQLSTFVDLDEKSELKTNITKRKTRSKCKNKLSFDVNSHLSRITGV